MNTTNESITEQPNKLKKPLSWIEAFLLNSLIIGVVLNYLNVNLDLLVYISLGGLGIIHFMYVYQTIEIPLNRETDKFEFNEMLAWIIISKVLFISSAMGLIGITN